MESESFADYLDAEYEHYGGDLYECMGGHVWHIDDIMKEYDRMVSEDSGE